MTMVEAGVVAEELGAAPHPGPWLSTAVAAPRALARFGAQDAQDAQDTQDTQDAQDTEAAKLLAGIADGSAIAAVGPLDDSAVAAVPQGTDVALRGQFSMLDAGAADVLLVLADNGLYAVPATSPGVSMTPEPGIDQTRKQFRVALDDAAGHRLAAASSDAAAAVVDDVLIATAADALGAGRAVLSLAVEYAKVRKQFGQAIGSFQAIQHLCVDMYETVELARSGVIHALWAADAAQSEERRLAALRAKAFAGRLATVGDTAIQVLGGIGYTWEHDAHLYLKRLLSWSALLGGPDRYLTEIGARLADSARKRRQP
jgi:alkylation response protein AidB-like acyl-CoA dehydrogenase